MHFDGTTLLWAFETSRRMFADSLSHSWFLGIMNADLSSFSSKVDPNPLSGLRFLWAGGPSSLLEALFLIAVTPFLLVFLVVRLLATAVKLILIVLVSVCLILGAALHGVKFGKRSQLTSENPS